MPPWTIAIIVSALVAIFILWRLKSKFIAASNLRSAVKVAERLAQKGYTPIINLLGEHYRSRGKIDRTVDSYHYLIDLLIQFRVKGRVSLKPTQIGLAVSKESYAWNLMAILRHAHSQKHIQDVSVEIDIERKDGVHNTLEVFRHVPGEFNVRQAIQAYFHVSERDIAEFIKRGRKVRLVKGAYAEGEFSKIQVDDRMIALSEQLIASARDPAIATVRDERLLKEIDDFVTATRHPKDSFEIQMLYGRRNDLKRSYKACGYRVAVYMPVGPWYRALPYLWRRIKEFLKSRFRRTPY